MIHLRLGLGAQVLLQHLADHTNQALAIWVGQAGPPALIQRAGRRGGSYRLGMVERPLKVIGLP
ncbi:MAG: hypothetical protein EA368_18030 [Leptolyngbya sp. DLM2.Bin27]|nr:MAG: hypothetical protein EA368_18030 [Leptolyngbya sp. DLM2.Bin27]